MTEVVTDDQIEVDPELADLLALLDTTTIESAPSFEELEENCVGSLVVATVNEIIGRDKCVYCPQKTECDRLLDPTFEAMGTWKKCFGRGHPATVKSDFCLSCHYSTLCNQAKNFAHYGKPGILERDAGLRRPAGSEKVVSRSGADEIEKIPDCAESRPESVSSGIVRSGYYFPIEEIRASSMIERYTELSTADLLKELKALKASVEESGKTIYKPHRNTLCAIFLVLNQRGDTLPRFRISPKGRFVGNKPGSLDDALLANDRRVIDLDWLARHRKRLPRDEATARMFSSDGLDYDAASAFVSTKGAAEKKARLLALTTMDEVPLSIIQGKAAGVTWQSLLKQRVDVLISIDNAIAANHFRRKDSSEWLWMIYAIHRLTFGRVAQTLELGSKLGNGKLSRQKLDRTLAWLRDEVDLRC